MTNTEALKLIHFVNDNGWVHSTSALSEIKGLDMRVFDAVQSVEECDDESVQAIFTNLSAGQKKTLSAMTPKRRVAFKGRMYSEAVEVAAFSATFLDNVMKYSPIRDYDSWINSGRGPYERSRRDRRADFLRGRILQ